MTKLVIQIPCFNEAETLAIALAALPSTLPGIETIEWLIVDDGSSDATADVARASGVHHIVHLERHVGLAQAFAAGLKASLAAGADIVVNTDADNQYCAADLPRLLEPILQHRADMVIGARDLRAMPHFSPLKKVLQRVGTSVVSLLSGTAVRDAPCGFRAFNRTATERLTVLSGFTYTHETIIQARRKDLRVESVPIRTNPVLRPSRLARNMATYVVKATGTILLALARYEPARLAAAGAVLALAVLGGWILSRG